MLDEPEVLAEQTAAAMRAIAETVRDAPPLLLAEVTATMPAEPALEASGTGGARRSLPRRWRLWLAPVAAAVTVAAAGVAVALVRVSPAAHPGPGKSPSAGASTARATSGTLAVGRVPPYYVAISAPAPGSTDRGVPLVVAATRTGRMLGQVATPPGTGKFSGVTGAADDRTFVVAAEPHGPSATDPYPPQAGYLLRLSASGSPASLTRLPIPATADGTAVRGIALSPDGSRLAMLLQPDAAASPDGPAVLRVYSVATGTVLRTWTTPASQVLFGLPRSGSGDPNTALRWVHGDRSLAIVASWPNRTPRPGTAATGPAGPLGTPALPEVLLLDTARPGGDLLAGSRLLSCPAVGGGHPASDVCGGGISDRQVTANGAILLQVTMGDYSLAPPGVTMLTVTWSAYSTSSGRLMGKLYGATVQGDRVRGLPVATIEWASPSGDTLIGYWPAKATHHRKGTNHFIEQLGIISQGRYTPLPAPPANSESVPDTIAW